MPFFAYLDRCTSTRDRIIVTGEFPDLVVLSGRAFASDGAVFGAWYSSATRQDRTLARLRERPALFVLLMDARAFRTRFPPIAAYIDDAYDAMTEVPVEGAGAGTDSGAAEPACQRASMRRRAGRVLCQSG